MYNYGKHMVHVFHLFPESLGLCEITLAKSTIIGTWLFARKARSEAMKNCAKQLQVSEEPMIPPAVVPHD